MDSGPAHPSRLLPTWTIILPNSGKPEFGGASRNDELQLQLPGLADEVDAKAVMLLLPDAAKPRPLVDSARGDQDALGPQRDRGVAGLPRKADALLRQRAPDAQPARLSLHQQQAQFCDLVGG